MKVLERLLWISGAVLLSIFIGHLTMGELQRAHAVAAFKAQQSIAGTAAVTADPEPVSAASTISDQTATQTKTQTATNSAPVNPAGEVASFDVDVDPPDQSLWSSGRIASYAASLKAETSEVIGLFSIPRLDLEVPLYDKASDLHMDRGIARIEGTAQPGAAGNMGIAGHRDGYFRVLKDIRFGDEMIVTSVNGPQTYRVEQLMIVDPSAVEVLDPTEEAAITLVTCYPFYFVGHAPERFIVRAVLQD
jgi:sortase A